MLKIGTNKGHKYFNWQYQSIFEIFLIQLSATFFHKQFPINLKIAFTRQIFFHLFPTPSNRFHSSQIKVISHPDSKSKVFLVKNGEEKEFYAAQIGDVHI